MIERRRRIVRARWLFAAGILCNAAPVAMTAAGIFEPDLVLLVVNVAGVALAAYCLFRLRGIE